jgi:hypothetical protein
VPERTTLYWKYEDGPPDAEDDDPNDLGPAWIIEPDGSERHVRDGEWITRAEALRLAEEEGYALDLDEGAPDPGDVAAAESVDVDALNSRLREIGVSTSELLVERERDSFHLTGTIPDSHARADKDGPEDLAGPEGYVPEPYLISYTVFSVEGLYEQLDEFAPGWR